MRINSVAAALGAAMLAGRAYAEDVQDDSAAAASASSAAPELPTFTVSLFLLRPICAPVLPGAHPC